MILDGKGKEIVLATVMICLLLLMGVSYVQFQFEIDQKNLRNVWEKQFIILFVLYAILSLCWVVAAYLDNIRLILLVIFFQLTCYFVICIPVQNELGGELTLLIMLILELNICFGRPFNFIAAFILIAGALIAQYPVVVFSTQLPKPSLNSLMSLAVYSSTFAIITGALMVLYDKLTNKQRESDHLNKIITQLATANNGFQEYAYDIMEKSTQGERNRIVRELHDTLGHSFTNIIMLLEAAISLVRKDDKKTTGILRKTRTQAQDGLNECRRVLRVLKEEQVAKTHGLRAIVKLLNTFKEATGIRLNVKLGNLPWSFHPTIELVLYRFVQESLTNALSHGKATCIDVVFRMSDDQKINLLIRDNGKGSSSLKKGLGISGMEERIRAIGGLFEIQTVDMGFAVSATIPMVPETDLFSVDFVE